MHKLDRTSVATPPCLANYSYPAQSWDDLAAPCKQELRDALALMQGSPSAVPCCAYCEGRIFHEGHIEHFRRKHVGHFPQLTFAWSNLFFACGSNVHCGHYKDRRGAPPYDPSQLIKPDEHEPDSYLFFHSSGEVRVRGGLNAADALRAEETIRVFGLDNGVLAGARANAISVYKKKVLPDLAELASWPLADQQAYLAEEVEATRHDPYASAVKHFLQSSIG